MTVDRCSLRDRLVEEVLDESTGLQGAALNEYLLESGFEPEQLLLDFASFLNSSKSAAGRKRFEVAKALLSSASLEGNVLSFDPSRKRQVFAALKERMAATGEMTIAARNQKIESEEDLDSFLDACFELGV